MTVLSLILRELLGLFVDDAFLALWVLAVVAFAGLLSSFLAAPPLAVGAFLFAGCVVVLLSSILGARRR